jgi:hypothetical protein
MKTSVKTLIVPDTVCRCGIGRLKRTNWIAVRADGLILTCPICSRIVLTTQYACQWFKPDELSP